MKICHMTSVHVPFDTRIFHKECKSLAAAGYEVHLIARHDKNVLVDGIHLHAIPGYKGKIKRMMYAAKAVYDKALEDDYAVFHFHDPELIPWGLLLKLRGKTVIYDVHEDYPEYFKYKEAFPRKFRWLFAALIGLLERFAVGKFDAALTVTPHIYDRLVRLNPNTFLVHNYPFADELSKGCGKSSPAKKTDSVVYVGSLTFDRGVRQMVRAVGIASETRPVRLLLAGDYASPADEWEIRGMPEYHHVDYRGHTSRRETADMLAEAKIGIVVCHPHQHYLHAYPTKLFEYMSVGLPVIVSDFPLWRTIIDEAHCGLAVDPMNPRELAKAILYLLDNPEEAREMGRRGREAVEKTYNWRNEETALVEIYRRLLEDASA